MKRRTFIQACLAALTVPLAAGGAVLEGALPAKRGGLSPEELDEFVELTLQRYSEQKFKDLAEGVETYLWEGKTCEGAPIGIDYWIIH